MKRITIRSTLGTLLGICFILIIFAGDRNTTAFFSLPVMMVKFLTIGIIIFIGSIYYTKIFLKTEKIIFTIETLPLLNTEEATDGIAFSCEGIVKEEASKLLQSPYSNAPCVYFHSIKEKYVPRGKSSEWVIIENLVNFVPFYVVDKRGKLKIDVTDIDSDFSNYKIDKVKVFVPDPENSEIDCTPVMKHQKHSEAGTFLKIIPTSEEIRLSEFVLLSGTRVFVSGYISKRNNELVLHEHPQHPLIISKKTKAEYIEEFYQGKNLVYFVHLLMATGFTISAISVNYFIHFNQILFLNILLLGNWLICMSLLFTMYNRIVTLQQRALNALSSIDIELKRRWDLIPQIVELVKGYSHHEENIQKAIADSRVQVIFQKELPEKMRFTDSSILAIIENYPQVKASEQYQGLMKSLVDTEGRIAYSRAFYNRNVRKYNTLIQQFPFIIISFFLNMRQMDFVSF